jgi:hypothetical protein
LAAGLKRNGRLEGHRRSYDEEFWPTLEAARQASQAVLIIKTLVLVRLPKEMK